MRASHKILYVCCYLSSIFCSCYQSDRANSIYKILPQIKNIRINDPNIEKIYLDPTYLKPYSIYIKFHVNTVSLKQQIINRLNLKKVKEIDTSVVRKKNSLARYKIYFKLQSLNANNSSEMSKRQNKIDWWPTKLAETIQPIYVVPYEDNGSIAYITSFDKESNGRLACYIDGLNFFILVECWDL